MNILAIDTSTKMLSLALAKDQKVLGAKDIELTKFLSSSIIPQIKGILKKTGVGLSKLDGFALGLGPGSFTSLRVGLSTVKGLCFALKKPVVGVCSLDIIAMNIKENNVPICVIIDARRDMVYACIYEKKEEKLRRLTDYLLIDLDSLLKRISKKAIFVGDGINIYRDKINNSKKVISFADEKYWYPQAKNIIPLSLERFYKKKHDKADKLVPIYLYAEDCQVQK